jgi:hypothetical protein
MTKYNTASVLSFFLLFIHNMLFLYLFNAVEFGGEILCVFLIM